MLIAAFRQCFENFPDLRLVGASVCVLFVLASPAQAQEAACNAPEKSMLDINLMFGRDVHGIHGVTEESWNDFMEKEIAKRFKGFTVLDGVGYWEGDRELSKRVLISIDAKCEEAVQTIIDEIVKAYRERFNQYSVGVVIDRVCVSFCRPRSSCDPQDKPPECKDRPL